MNPQLPFPHRLTQASWAAEWPLLPQFGAGTPPAQSGLPASMGWAWQSATSVRSAIDGTGHPVPLDLAHRFLDELESWTARHRALLTWPATPVSFARALVASAQQNDASLVSVLVAYPAYCQMVLEQARSVDPSVPTLDRLFPQASAGPFVASQPSPTPVEPSGPPTPTPTVDPAPPTPERPVRPRLEVPAEPPEFLVRWAETIAAEREPALAKQYLDQQLKSSLAAYEGSSWQWFSRVLFPGLATLPLEQLQVLINAWPSHNRFTPPNPVQVVDSAPFWVVMREAGGARRDLLSTGGLASMLNLDAVSPETRLEMATKMFPFVSKKASAFRQRLQLWMSLGGDLDEAVDPAGVEGVSASSVRDWIAQQSNEEWNAVVEGMKPAPSTRFVRRGPG